MNSKLIINKIQSILSDKKIKLEFINLKTQADNFIKKNYANISRGFYPSAEQTTQLHLATKKNILNSFNLNNSEYDVFFNNDFESIKKLLNENSQSCLIKINKKSNFLKNDNLIVFNSLDLNTFFNTYVICIKKTLLKNITPNFLGGGMVKTVKNKNEILYEESIKKMEAGTQSIIQIIYIYFAIKNFLN